jgi:hypothetical protein
VGYTRQSLNSVRGNTTNSNFVSDITGYESIGAGSQAGGPNVGSGRTRWTLASYLGRVNYSLLDRYLFTVTGRRDGSSRFGAEQPWGFFPPRPWAGALSEESFLRDVRGPQQPQAALLDRPSPATRRSRPYQSLNRLLPQQYTFGGQLAPGISRRPSATPS